MKIESLSIKSSTIAIFGMIGTTAVVLSLLAGSYFKQAAMDAQMKSLSRVIEVASQEMLKKVRNRTFDLGMKLGHSPDLISAVNVQIGKDNTGSTESLTQLLDDPFVNGFVGVHEIDLDKIRVYNMDLELIAQSSAGSKDLGDTIAGSISTVVANRKAPDRLKAIDVLWMSTPGPRFSTLVPLGGLRPIGYLEIVVNPVFNLPDIGKITKTPVHFYSMSGTPLDDSDVMISDGYLPVEFTLLASDGAPAFKIIGYENIHELNLEMDQTQTVAISGFLLLSLCVLMVALWLFNRFLFLPVSRMTRDMDDITHGKLELTVDNKGLREFHIFADAFNSMTEQVRMRTNDLQRLLDLDDSALMCFDHDNDAVYFNVGATALFGYSSDEIIDLDIDDLFIDDISSSLKTRDTGCQQQDNLYTLLHCKHKDGSVFQCNASINNVDVMGQSGIAIALNAVAENEQATASPNDRRLNAVEQTLSSLLAFARENPGAMPGLANLGLADINGLEGSDQKVLLREHGVKLMNQSLACWEHDVGRSKIDLAEESGLWPVYIDKSTPTTRTLDKYLNIELCPKNPRSQRVIDTAEFVLRKAGGLDTAKRTALKESLDLFRQLLSGIKPAN